MQTTRLTVSTRMIPFHPARRGFLGGLASVGACLGATSTSHGAPPAEAAPQNPTHPRNPNIYHFRIGDLEAWSISDGHLRFREGLDLMWPAEERPRMRTFLESRGEPLDGLPLYINILLVRHGREVVLFDAGFPRGGNPDLGWTFNSIQSVGIKPEEVTMALLSHAHADHLGGFVHDGRPAFPNAALHFLPEEHAFWHAKEPDFSKSKRDPASLPGMIRTVREQFEVLRGLCRPVPAGTALLDGRVTIEAAPGHTAGHAVFRIRSQGHELLHLADLAHHDGLMFEQPDWYIGFDHDAEEAIRSRRRHFARAAADRTRCFGFHLPWPGLGRILPGGAGYHWHPEPWNWAV
jgi:glyoxylase-like metal-dependent hydrolase (beta-lactamase superfamily II)